MGRVREKTQHSTLSQTYSNAVFQVVYLKGDFTMKEKNLGLKEINVPSALVL